MSFSPSLTLAGALLVAASATAQDAAKPARYYVYSSDSFDSGTADSWNGRRRWTDAAAAQRIEWHDGGTDRAGPVEANAGGKRWPFVRDRERGVTTLIVTEEVRQAWEHDGSLAIRPGDGAVVRLLARPRRLYLDAATTFTVAQRTTVAVPGSRQWLEVSIDDITAGQVRLGVRTAERTELVPARSVSRGDVIDFRVGEQAYSITVQRLVNLLIGEDFAELVVEAGEVEGVRTRIEALLARIKATQVTFVREDERYTGADAVAHLLTKYGNAESEVKTLDDFIDKIASRSSLTGRDYLVETADGETIKAADWLRTQARSMQEKAKPGAADRNAQRVAAARLEPGQTWTWGKDTTPALPFGRGTLVTRMCFTADGRGLAFERGDQVFGLTLPDGAPRLLAEGDVSLAGPAGDDRLLLRIGTELWRADTSGKRERASDLTIPERSDSWSSPFAPRVLTTGLAGRSVRTQLIDLHTGAAVRLRNSGDHPTAVAWHPDDRLFAFGRALFVAGGGETGEGIRVYTTAGELVRGFDDRGTAVRALDLSTDGRVLTWVDDRIRRADLEHGTELNSTEGRPEFWANVDPVLAVSHDGTSLSLWNGVTLERVRTIALGEDRPELPPQTYVLGSGVVLGTAIAPKRTHLALATFAGLRVYRIAR